MHLEQLQILARLACSTLIPLWLITWSGWSIQDTRFPALCCLLKISTNSGYSTAPAANHTASAEICYRLSTLCWQKRRIAQRLAHNNSSSQAIRSMPMMLPHPSWLL